MIERTNKIPELHVLLVVDREHQGRAASRASQQLAEELRANRATVILADGLVDGQASMLSDPSFHGLLVPWELGGGDTGNRSAFELISLARSRNASIPIFLLADNAEGPVLSEDLLTLVSEMVWLLEDSTSFVVGRILAAARKYSRSILGPMASALIEFDLIHEYSWHTPGHTGGTAFQKSPAGRQFFDYFGEQLFRSDISISVGELGSLLDHSGPIGEGEKYAAQVFGAHRSYTVTNGSSTSNRIIWMACVGRDKPVLVDRNCHKSTEQGLTLTGGAPHYLLPTRNRYGIIGPIPPERLTPDKLASVDGPVYSIITNSTYDGLTYNVDRVVELLGQSVDRIHFDEAWYGYARFHSIYAGRFTMRGNPDSHPDDGPTLFATHSTHKLLAAFSQASFIHIRDGRNPVDHARFNESFMMHGSTSPFYPIIASNDVTCSMMDGKGGETLVGESILEAVAFRQTVMRIWRAHRERNDWFLRTWNPSEVSDGKGGTIPFDEADPAALENDPSHWVLRPGEAWHGFDLEDEYCMLDPIKVSLLTPGVGDDGSLDEEGIPAALLTAYLDERGIIVEKTTDFTILFLFSIGVTNAKWSTLVHALLAFKRDVDNNRPLADTIPHLATHYPGHGLRDLARTMMRHLIQSQQLSLQSEAFSVLPVQKMNPAEAYQHLVNNDVETITLKSAAGRIAATGLVPYPPGIPLVMPGENLGSNDDPFLAYLTALEEWDRFFPGFAHDIHGIEAVDGNYQLMVLKE
ncbi:MAG: Orn/Lys/Arg decarboxylase N-terminal domain-containing protein [Verrucomicrobiota bacterium]